MWILSIVWIRYQLSAQFSIILAAHRRPNPQIAMCFPEDAVNQPHPVSLVRVNCLQMLMLLAWAHWKYMSRWCRRTRFESSLGIGCQRAPKSSRSMPVRYSNARINNTVITYATQAKIPRKIFLMERIRCGYFSERFLQARDPSNHIRSATYIPLAGIYKNGARNQT